MNFQQLLEITSNLQDEGGNSLLSSREILERIIEYDKWKTEATFSHEIKIQELKLLSTQSRRTIQSKPQVEPEGTISENDRKFNVISSYGACDDKHIGLISKTNVWNGANEKALVLFQDWYSDIQENNIIPLKDLKEGRIKTLLLLFLWASGCAHRIAKWPDAPDVHYASSVKRELEEKFSKFSKHSIIAAYESLKVFWKEINDYENCPFNTTLIGEILDEAYQYVTEKNLEESKYDLKKSPLFEEFEKNFPYVSLDILEKYYTKNRKNFVAGGIGALRKVFTTSLPEELEHRYSSSEWPKKWHLHISSFEEKWKQKLNQILTEKRGEQEKWKEE